MRVLVTGATGFVGSHLVRTLTGHGAAVRALVRSPARARPLLEAGVETVTGGLDAASLERALVEADVVLHLAATTRSLSAAEHERVNGAGTAAVIDAALNAPTPPRVVYLSSLAAVGPSWDGRPVDRTTPPRPITAYGRGKLAGERACEAGAARGLQVVIVRAPAVYGPGDRDILRFFRLAGRGLLPLPAGGSRRVQMLHVHDLTTALWLAASVPGALGVFHAAEPRSYTWEEAGERIVRAVGRGRIVHVPEALIRAAGTLSEWAARLSGRDTIFNRDKVWELLAPAWICETETAERELGFRARIPLAEGLAQTAAWYRAQGWLARAGDS